MWSWKFNSPVKFSELKRESGEITRLPLKDRKLIIVRFQTTQRAQININLMGIYICYIYIYIHVCASVYLPIPFTFINTKLTNYFFHSIARD